MNWFEINRKWLWLTSLIMAWPVAAYYSFFLGNWVESGLPVLVVNAAFILGILIVEFGM